MPEASFEREREREIPRYVYSDNLAHKDGFVFMSGHLQDGCEAMADSL